MASGTVIPFHLRALEAAFFTRGSCWLDMLGEEFAYCVAKIIDIVVVIPNVTPPMWLIIIEFFRHSNFCMDCFSAKLKRNMDILHIKMTGRPRNTVLFYVWYGLSRLVFEIIKIFKYVTNMLQNVLQFESDTIGLQRVRTPNDLKL